jgi:hypothetical protein
MVLVKIKENYTMMKGNILYTHSPSHRKCIIIFKYKIKLRKILYSFLSGSYNISNKGIL